MASLKVVLRKVVKQDGTSPLAIRVTKDRKSSFIYLDYSIKETDWDNKNQRVRKSHRNSGKLNAHIIDKLAEVTNHALDLEKEQPDATAKSVRKKTKSKTDSSVYAVADLYLEELKKAGKYNRYSSDSPRVKHLKAYLGGDVRFRELTVASLERFKVYLKGTYGMSERSAVNHLVVVRSLFSQAIKDGVCDPKYYPFGKGKITIKFPDSIKVGLTPQEITKLETCTLEGAANDARNVWLIAFYFAGMRISDALRLKWSDFSDNRLTYKMGKNDKAGSLKIPEKALVILEQYKHGKTKNDALVFPYLNGIDFNDKFATQRAISTKMHLINDFLKDAVTKAAKIDKKLTMHIARHSFAQIAGDKIPIQMLQKLYRHSSITTTIGYQSNFIHKDADSALDAVINS